jgi:predicted TIM-barrel fold metal-dependent hydrolase
MIIDCHCHVVCRGGGLSAPQGARASQDRYLLRAEEAGITRTVLFSDFHSDYALANRQVARLVASCPTRFYGFAFVHAQRDRGRVHIMIQQAVERYGFCGIKVHRHDARITREVCEAARKFSLPVQVSLINCLAEYKNIYTDTSGIRYFDLLRQAVQRAGAHKILFGSDGPWLHPALELEKIYALGLSCSEEQLILGGNFLRLISRIPTLLH